MYLLQGAGPGRVFYDSSEELSGTLRSGLAPFFSIRGHVGMGHDVSYIRFRAMLLFWVWGSGIRA
jgi:hypothetical protein